VWSSLHLGNTAWDAHMQWAGIRMRRQRKKRVKMTEPDRLTPKDVPRCCTCDKPLLRLPPSITSSAPRRVFQCAGCFYPGIGQTPKRSGPVKSDASRWLGGRAPDS